MASNDEQRSATTIITTAAQSIAARLIANETTAKFTKAEISTTNLFNQSVTELQVLTSLDNVQQTADINTVTVINDNTVNVNVAIDQTKAPNNYQMNSVGLFAVDGDGKEVLYSVTVLKDPVYIHQDAMGSALGIDLETVVGQASNVEISVNPAGAVTNEILKAALADYVKADDSTVVHTADMRKPANQVASIDEVNTKQDKIGYTPADDSTVVHTADMRKPASDVVGLEDITQTALPDGTDFYTLINTDGRPLQYFASSYTHAQTMINKPASVLSTFILITSSVNNRTTTTYNYTFLNLRNVSTGDSYEALINTDGTGKIVVTRPWHKLADDSKVAHLSGANNFDTIPTVNNNPLLLASSLPSDLARTGQDANFTAKLQQNGQDVALANNTIARNPNTGVVSTPTDFTKLTVNGGKSVATSDDLKSLEDSAWRRLDFDQSCNLNGLLSSSHMIYQIHPAEKYLSLFYLGEASSKSMVTFDGSLPIMDLKTVVKGIESLDFYAGKMDIGDGYGGAAEFMVSGTKITVTSGHSSLALSSSSATIRGLKHADCRIYYSELI
ncbi:hypothetical protein [Levilactobacillus brevis]|uniref:hypothetical protein n=1 Tax=Levilactobacillus brevis TaxID=1580 RepID=UPI000A2FA85C|nr:hypothetical protein [Levilactobacillus brevis]ARQ94261.1 hypothetical protein A6F60_11385 [Levilactobacillus brevis]